MADKPNIPLEALVGAQIRALRTALGMALSDLAAAAGRGSAVSFPTPKSPRSARPAHPAMGFFRLVPEEDVPFAT